MLNIAKNLVELSLQMLENWSADKTVAPYILRRGLVSKQPNGSYENVSNTHPIPVMDGFSIPAYDYFSMALSVGDTTETYIFKTGGVGGTVVATITIVYTDNTREIIVSGTKT